jgi:hypothetical protein
MVAVVLPHLGTPILVTVRTDSRIEKQIRGHDLMAGTITVIER